MYPSIHMSVIHSFDYNINFICILIKKNLFCVRFFFLFWAARVALEINPLLRTMSFVKKFIFPNSQRSYKLQSLHKWSLKVVYFRSVKAISIFIFCSVCTRNCEKFLLTSISSITKCEGKKLSLSLSDKLFWKFSYRLALGGVGSFSKFLVIVFKDYSRECVRLRIEQKYPTHDKIFSPA